jgi:hypothetical protein
MLVDMIHHHCSLPSTNTMDKRLLLRDRKGNSDSQFLITTNINGFDGIWTDIGIKLGWVICGLLLIKRRAQRDSAEKTSKNRLSPLYCNQKLCSVNLSSVIIAN